MPVVAAMIVTGIMSGTVIAARRMILAVVVGTFVICTVSAGTVVTGRSAANEVAVAVADRNTGAGVLEGIDGSGFGFQHRTGRAVQHDLQLLGATDCLDLGLGQAVADLDPGEALCLIVGDKAVDVDLGKGRAAGDGEEDGKGE